MYDVIIIGSGIAGSLLAQKLSKTKLDFIIIEKTKDLKDDSGIISAQTAKNIPSELIKSKINQMNFISPHGYHATLKTEKPFAYIIHRKRYLDALRKPIRKKIRFETVENISWSNHRVSVYTNQGAYDCKLLVGADGALSLTRRRMFEEIEQNEKRKLPEPEINFGVVSRNKIAERQRREYNKKLRSNFTISTAKPITVYFNKHFSADFFAWSIPQSNEHGLIAKRPLEYFEIFQKHLGFESDDKINDSQCESSKFKITEARRAEAKFKNLRAEKIIAPIATPTKNYYKSHNSFYNNSILVGEAACQTKPLTAGGIDFAFKAVEHAFTTIIEAFRENNFSSSFLTKYDHRWKNDFGQDIYRQIMLKEIYKRLTNRQIDSLFKNFAKNIEEIRDIEYASLSSILSKLPLRKIAVWYFKNIL